MRQWRHSLVLAATLLVLWPVESSAPAAPVASSQQTTAPAAAIGDFVWHDLVTDDPAAARKFYGALLGWTFAAGEGVDPGYTIIRRGTVPIGGIVTRRSRERDGGPAQWLTYVAVGDVDRAADSFSRAGGRIFRGPLQARKDLRVAAVADPQGAALGLASRGPHFVTSSASGLHEWLWMEYVAEDPEEALDFYATTIGFRFELGEQRNGFRYYVLSNERPRAGLFRSVWNRGASAWLPYVRVDDPAAMAVRVAQLGGTVVMSPQPRVRNSSLAIVLDPSGAVLALQKFPFDTGVSE